MRDEGSVYGNRGSGDRACPPPRLLPTPQERAARESLTSTANNLEEGEGRTGGAGPASSADSWRVLTGTVQGARASAIPAGKVGGWRGQLGWQLSWSLALVGRGGRKRGRGRAWTRCQPQSRHCLRDAGLRPGCPREGTQQVGGQAERRPLAGADSASSRVFPERYGQQGTMKGPVRGRWLSPASASGCPRFPS